MLDPCFPVLDSEVSTEAPSSYLNQVLRFEKGKTKNLVLALGWNWDQTTRAWCLWVVAARRQWAVNPGLSLSGQTVQWMEGMHHQTFPAALFSLVLFHSQNLFYLQIGKKEGQEEVKQCVAHASVALLSVSCCLSLCFPPRKRLCPCMALDWKVPFPPLPPVKGGHGLWWTCSR